MTPTNGRNALFYRSPATAVGVLIRGTATGPLVALLFGAAAPAQAAGGESYLAAALTKTTDENKTNDNKSSDDVTILNLSFAYGLGSGFGIGAKYFDYSQDGRFLDDENLKIQGWGPLVSYRHTSGLFAQVAYLIGPAKKYHSAGQNYSFEGGDGYVIDAGFATPISGPLSAGLQFTQSHVVYRKLKTDRETTKLKGTWSDDSFYPYLTLMVSF